MLAGNGSIITCGASTPIRDNLPRNVALVSNDKGNISASTLSVNQIQGVISGGATTIIDYNLTANKALISSSEGKVATSTVTNLELGYLAGTTDVIKNSVDQHNEPIIYLQCCKRMPY